MRGIYQIYPGGFHWWLWCYCSFSTWWDLNSPMFFFNKGLTVERRPSLIVAINTPWARVTRWEKQERRNSLGALTTLCFLTPDVIWPPASWSYCCTFPPSVDCNLKLQAKPAFVEIVFDRHFVKLMRMVTNSVWSMSRTMGRLPHNCTQGQ